MIDPTEDYDTFDQDIMDAINACLKKGSSGKPSKKYSLIASVTDIIKRGENEGIEISLRRVEHTDNMCCLIKFENGRVLVESPDFFSVYMHLRDAMKKHRDMSS